MVAPSVILAFRKQMQMEASLSSMRPYLKREGERSRID